MNATADRLNRNCFCVTLDRDALCRVFEREAGDKAFCNELIRTRPHLFTNTPAFVPRESIADMQAIVQAVEKAAASPAYQQCALSWAPLIARVDHGPAGALMGYDFHLTSAGPKLIEINTNAGGAFLNALLARAQLACCEELVSRDFARPEDFESKVIHMFREEWRRQRGDAPLLRIAIVDDSPREQYLYPEFVLVRETLRAAGIEAFIADAKELAFKNGRMLCDALEIDLVYNRLVDFALDSTDHAAVRSAYEEGSVVMTPNPRNHALLADKRNLTLLSDPDFLDRCSIGPVARSALLGGVPRTVCVTQENADALWASRKGLFFKPASGHGSKAVYRGDKITRGVWNEILRGAYVAQDYAPPGERILQIGGAPVAHKVDVRLYTYAGETLLVAARIYQGQTTNMRTPGGGFAPVFAV